MRDRLSILFCSSPNFFQHVAVAAVSSLENNAVCLMDIHLIPNGSETNAEQQLK